jgi:hypothetical protein
MQRLLDILASGVHDAKNQLFIAESMIAASEAAHGISMGKPATPSKRRPTACHAR